MCQKPTKKIDIYNQHYTWLICTAQNMKNISIKKAKVNGKSLTNTHILETIINFFKKSIFIFKNDYA